MWRTASGLPRLLLERQPRTSERLSMLCFLVAALQQTSTLFVLPSQWSEDGCTQAMPLLSSRGTCVQALWLSLDRKFSLLTGHAAYHAYPMLSGHGLADLPSRNLLATHLLTDLPTYTCSCAQLAEQHVHQPGKLASQACIEP